MLDRRSIVALVILSVLGLLGNLLKIEMFFNVDFLFGSIFAMLAVQIFGFYGIIVAFIAGLYTIVLWNHPYAVVIFTAEAAFVAVFQRRFKNIVAADLLYWSSFCRSTSGSVLLFCCYGSLHKADTSHSHETDSKRYVRRTCCICDL